MSPPLKLRKALDLEMGSTSPLVFSAIWSVEVRGNVFYTFRTVSGQWIWNLPWAEHRVPAAERWRFIDALRDGYPTRRDAVRALFGVLLDEGWIE